MQKTYALSFKDLKQRISIEQVLRHYNLFETLELRGKSHRGPCPFCEEAEGRPFSVSLEKSCYQCFVCHASGNILDFVMQWEGVKVREAGEILATNFVDGKTSHKAIKDAKPEPPQAQEASTVGGEASEPTKSANPNVPNGTGEGSEGMAGESADTSSPAEVPAGSVLEGETPSRNEPLTFGLKNIASDHPSVQALGIDEDTLTSFGVGYYGGKGMMGNHIVIPIFNPKRELIAYAGVHPTEHTYIYPPKFKRELELYNLGCALDALRGVIDVEVEEGLILVRHPLEALMLISAGYLNAAAILGETISEEQIALLLAQHGVGEKVTLFWPTHADVVPTLSELLPHCFVRLRRYEERKDTPLGFTAEDVSELLA